MFCIILLYGNILLYNDNERGDYMKTSIPFMHKTTKIKSNCGDPLEIKLSSKELSWDGILVERGVSPFFHPKDVVTPNFYFAIEMQNTFDWSVTKNGEQIDLHTEPGDIWVNPPYTPFTHNIDVPCNFLIVNISQEKLFKSFDGKLPDNLEFLNNYSLQDKPLEHFLYLLLFETENKGKNGKDYIDNIIKMISNYYIKHYSNFNDLIKHRKPSSLITNEDMLEIDNYIEENLSIPITIEDLASILSVSKFYFLKEFKRANMITPYQYIIDKKMKAAKGASQPRRRGGANG